MGEFGRALRPGGGAVIYQMTATDWLTPAEAARLWPPVGIYASSVDPQRFEAAIAAGGLSIGGASNWAGNGVSGTRRTGAGRTCLQLLQVSRLLRNRPAYQERFGADAYEAMLGNCLWGVYQMIGKLNPRVYLLHRCPAGLGAGRRTPPRRLQANSLGTRTGQYARRHSPGQRNHRPRRVGDRRCQATRSHCHVP